MHYQLTVSLVSPWSYAQVSLEAEHLVIRLEGARDGINASSVMVIKAAWLRGCNIKEDILLSLCIYLLIFLYFKMKKDQGRAQFILLG